MKKYGLTEVQFHILLTSVLDGSGQLHDPAVLLQRTEPGTC
jgi:hypothetical protein